MERQFEGVTQKYQFPYQHSSPKYQHRSEVKFQVPGTMDCSSSIILLVLGSGYCLGQFPIPIPNLPQPDRPTTIDLEDKIKLMESKIQDIEDELAKKSAALQIYAIGGTVFKTFSSVTTTARYRKIYLARVVGPFLTFSISQAEVCTYNCLNP